MRPGTVTLGHRSVNISAALGGWDVGLEPIQAQRYAVWFCRLRLGELDLTTEKFHAVRPTNSEPISDPLAADSQAK